MSIWDDLSDSDQDDYLPAPGIDDDDDQGEDIEDEIGTWTPSQGFPDQFNAVRVWGDPDGQLTKVRVSLSWRDKVGEEGLARAFGICFLVMNNYYPAPDEPTLPEPEPQRVTERLTGENLAQIRNEISGLQARLAQLPAEVDGPWQGERVRGSDFEDGIVVVLDVFGRPEVALFDPEWLATKPNARSIARGVLTAYRQARRKFTPPQPVFSERAQLHQQLRQVNDRYLQMLGNGVLRTS